MNKFEINTTAELNEQFATPQAGSAVFPNNVNLLLTDGVLNMESADALTRIGTAERRSLHLC
jgi:hypothetical protein